MEPGILKGCHMRQNNTKDGIHYNGSPNARHHAVHQRRHRHHSRHPDEVQRVEWHWENIFKSNSIW